MLLTFSSANTDFQHHLNEFIRAASHLEFERLRYTAGRVVLHMGEVILLRFAAHMLERMVSVLFFFAWGVV